MCCSVHDVCVNGSVRLFVALGLCCGYAATELDQAAGGLIPVSTSSELQAALTIAAAGDEIVMSPGVYPGRFTATALNGVTLRSADPANRGIIDADGLGEGLKFSSVKNVTVSDVIIRNASVNGINIDDAGFIEPSENITLRELRLENGGGDGIKLTRVVGFHIDRVQVIGWGGSWTGVNFLGSQQGVVERSYIENTSPGSGTGIQAKAGAADIVIRANRFVNANERSVQIGGSGGHTPAFLGDVQAARIVAEGNVILNNGGASPGIRAAASFVNVGDGVFRNNVVYRPGGYVFRILSENPTPPFIETQGGVIAGNIVLWNQGDLLDTLNSGANTLPETFTFEDNRWFNITSPANSQPSLPADEVGGTYGVNPEVDLQGVTPWDYSWGKWLVNTSNLTDSVTLPAGESFLLATPNEGASLDLDNQVDPLVGSWSLSPVNSELFDVDPFSYAILIRDAPIAGDYNSDSAVDGLDLDLWRAGFVSQIDLAADGDRNGVVDGADFLIWQKAVGATSSFSAAVPEPVSGFYGFGFVLCAARHLVSRDATNRRAMAHRFFHTPDATRRLRRQ